MITFLTRQYEFAHGHKPRGTGFWAFTFAGNVIIPQLECYGSFGAAKAEAQRVAKAAGFCGDITVLS